MTRRPRGSRRLQEAFFRSVKSRQEGAWASATDREKADAIAEVRLPMQAAVADDPGKRISVRCPRRAGKSYTAVSIALERCLRMPRSNWVIVGLTRESTRAIYWRPLKFLSERMELGMDFHNTFLTATFPNGSTLRFLGGSTRDEIEKLRGAAYHGVILDECKSFNPVVFEELISDVIGPALGDHSGTLYLIGTPGSILSGPFFEATCEPPILRTREDGTRGYTNWRSGRPCDLPFEWSLHTWSRMDNTSLRDDDGRPKLWREALSEKERKGWSDDSPSWRREYLGEWVQGDNLLVYRYSSARNGFDGGLPDAPGWQFVMGADFGYRDAFALVVWAYSPHCRGLWEVTSVSAPRLTIPEMIELVQRVEDNLPGEVVLRVGDPGYGGLNIMATLGQHHGLPFVVAEKNKKLDYINAFNDDLETGLIRIRAGGALEAELVGNRWLERTLGKIPMEDPATKNDLCDAALYAWRHCRHRVQEARQDAPGHGSPEWWADLEARMEQAVVDRHTRSRRSDDSADGLDGDFN